MRHPRPGLVRGYPFRRDRRIEEHPIKLVQSGIPFHFGQVALNQIGRKPDLAPEARRSGRYVRIRKQGAIQTLAGRLLLCVHRVCRRPVKVAACYCSRC